MDRPEGRNLIVFLNLTNVVLLLILYVVTVRHLADTFFQFHISITNKKQLDQFCVGPYIHNLIVEHMVNLYILIKYSGPMFHD